MTVFEHNYRSRIYNPGQHPYKHSLDDFTYNNSALPTTAGITSLQNAMDWLFAVLYPRSKDAVATPADLPLVGNVVLDYRVVTDDGDGKAASYRWEQREGDATPKWYKIYDMDWGEGSILARFLDQTQDLYVYKMGVDDLDSSGTAVAGTLAGQTIYGGHSASTNLTLIANSGDAAGAHTGYVQVGNSFRPTTDAARDIGTSSLKFKDAYFSGTANIGTLVATGGSITDSSGAISFDNENLTTTGYLHAGALQGTSLTVLAASTTTINTTITNSTGTVSFSDNHLLTTGHVTATSLITGTLTVSDGSIVDTDGTINFSSNTLTTTGPINGGAITGTSFVVGTTTITSHTLADTSGGFSFGSVNLSTTGTLAAHDTTITGAISATTTVTGGNVRLTGNSIVSTDTNGNVNLAPNGTGIVTVSCILKPTTDAARDLGTTALRWQNIYLSGSLGDGTNTISIANLLTFRAVGSPNTGDALFWDGSKWVASAPDTEITHSTLSGLTTGDAGHTQFALLAGRSGGQSLNGGTAASENLTLDSTAHATKGKILAKSDIAANTDASFSSVWSGTNLGGASNRFNAVYTAGEFFGLRVENLSSDPSSAASRTGRLWWNTTTGYLGVDNGSAVQRLSVLRYQTDTSWDGSTTVKNVTVSGIDAQQALWQLKDNTNNYEIMAVKIEATTTTNVRITANVNLPAGSYRLTGLQ